MRSMNQPIELNAQIPSQDQRVTLMPFCLAGSACSYLVALDLTPYTPSALPASGMEAIWVKEIGGLAFCVAALPAAHSDTAVGVLSLKSNTKGKS
jgi:hypothetical protein